MRSQREANSSAELEVSSRQSVLSSEKLEKGRTLPIVTLLLLSPVVSELLFGTTRVTILFVLLPQIGTWGCAALIIREIVRRRRGGWLAMLLFGLALAAAEECVIQQTSLAPLVGADPDHIYGRAQGVNWVYLLWALGYESVWVVLTPVQLAELIFPERRDQPWLKTRGLVIASCVFLFASLVAWYSWTQLYVPTAFPESAYRVPGRSIAVGLGVALALALSATCSRRRSAAVPDRIQTAPRWPWLFLFALSAGLLWFCLVFLAYGAVPSLPVVVPMAIGVVLAAAGVFLIARWSTGRGWRDSHALALSAGAIGASMAAGFPLLVAMRAPTIDFAGKALFNLIAVILLVRLASRLTTRKQRQEGHPAPAEPE